MKKNKFYILLITFYIALALAISDCKKDKPVYSNTPEIEFVSVAPTTVTQYKDEITFTISYNDGDGDLGQNDPNVTNLFLTDNRINITYGFRIPQLAPDNANIIIKGNLSVILKNTGITDGSSSQTATYSIYVKDRAGNTSNTITTSAITVNQ